MYYYEVNDTTIQNDEGLYIPIDTSNSNYQEYLAWIAAGNTLGSPFATPSGGSALLEFGNLCLDQSMVHNGTSGRVLYNNSGVLGELTATGTGSVVLGQGPTINNPTLTGTLTAGGSAGTSGQVLQSTGTGVTWQTAASSLTPMQADGRLTVYTNDPVVGEGINSTLYYTPYVGDRITLYTGATWVLNTFTELSIAVPATSNTNYDVFIYDTSGSGTLTLELTEWANNTDRAIQPGQTSALTILNGVLVKTGALKRRYIGTIRTGSTSGTISDMSITRHVWNMYNRLPHPLLCQTTGNYTYSTAAWREAGGISTIGLSRVSWVQGLLDCVSFTNYTLIYVTGTNGYPANGIGIDVTATNSALIRGSGAIANMGPYPSLAFFDYYTAQGSHFAARLEYGVSGATVQWFNGAGAATSGMIGRINC